MNEKLCKMCSRKLESDGCCHWADCLNLDSE